jgi:hypothetical protein
MAQPKKFEFTIEDAMREAERREPRLEELRLARKGSLASFIKDRPLK